LGAAGWVLLGAAGLAGALWLIRIPIAQTLVSQALSARGAAHDLTIESLDFSGAKITNFRIGPRETPTLSAKSVHLAFAWQALPTVSALDIDGLRVVAALDENGLNWGALAPFLEPPPQTPTADLPVLRLRLTDAQLALETPLGKAVAVAQADGVIRSDWALTGQMTGPSGLTGALAAQSGPQQASASFTLANGSSFAGLAGIEFKGLNGKAGLNAGPNLERPSIRATMTAESATAPDWQAAGLNLSITGDWTAAPAGVWTASAQAAQGFGVSGETASASGVWSLAPEGPMANGIVRAPNLKLSQPVQRAIRSWSAPADTPFAAPLASLRNAALAAAPQFAATVQLRFTGADSSLWLDGLSIKAASGAQLLAKPIAARLAFARLAFARQAFEGAAPRVFGDITARLQGGGFSTMAIQANSDGKNIIGTAALATVNANDASLSAILQKFTFDLNANRYSADGLVLASGPLAGGRIEELKIPIALAGRIGEGFSVAPQAGCLALSARLLTAAGGRFADPALSLCPSDGAFLRVAPSGAMSGGATVAGRRFPGALSGTGEPAALSFIGASIRFSGEDILAEVSAPAFEALLSAGPLSAKAERIRARIGPKGATGALEGGVVDGAALPVEINDVSIDFETEEEAMRLTRGRARVSDPRPPNALEQEWRARFNPILLDNIQGRLDAGLVTAKGDVVLESGARRLGAFTASHNLKETAGEATVSAEALMFTPQLDAYDISEPIRGVASDVRGRLDAELDVAWAQGDLAAKGVMRFSDVSFKTASLGPVEGVNGEIVFEDLLALRSAPNQRFTIGRLDPGIGVVDGEIGLQILSPNRVRIEDAAWPFAGGKLFVTPQDIDLSTRIFDVTLNLSDVNLTALIETLDLADLTATGQVTGAFPLKFDEQGGEIVNGVLTSRPGGGMIAYTGLVSEALKGPPRVAFDALQAFQYDSLKITLNGRLEGDVNGEIAFTGVNTAPIRDMQSLAPIPGLTLGEATGLPFDFDVSVTAPFRRLLRTYQGVVDARTYARQALDQMDSAVDPPPLAPR
jgi:hypothetical protein